jgi:hypothetical protein
MFSIVSPDLRNNFRKVLDWNPKFTILFNGGSPISSPFGSTSFTGLFAQYTYGLNEGYFEAIGSTLNQMDRSLL